VRWEALFTDMELQLDAARARGLADEVAELTRAERAGVGLAARVRAQRGPLELGLRSGGTARGDVLDAGETWVLLGDARREHLVPLAGVQWLDGLSAGAAPEAGPVLRRLGLGHALRAIARDRAVVVARAGGTLLQGRVDSVGADHVDLTLAAADSLRPTGRRRVVPFGALEALSTC
jgi:hypothetical protein